MASPPPRPTEDVVGAVVIESARRFKAALKGVQVLPAWPGETVEAKSVWCSEIVAESREVPGFVGDEPVMVDEVYSVLWEVEVHDEITAEDTLAEMSQIIGVLDRTLRVDPRMGNFPGVTYALFTTPYKRTVGLSPTGAHGYAQLNQEIVIRLY